MAKKGLRKLEKLHKRAQKESARQKVEEERLETLRLARVENFNNHDFAALYTQVEALVQSATASGANFKYGTFETDDKVTICFIETKRKSYKPPPPPKRFTWLPKRARQIRESSHRLPGKKLGVSKRITVAPAQDPNHAVLTFLHTVTDDLGHEQHTDRDQIDFYLPELTESKIREALSWLFDDARQRQYRKLLGNDWLDDLEKARVKAERSKKKKKKSDKTTVKDRLANHKKHDFEALFKRFEERAEYWNSRGATFKYGVEAAKDGLPVFTLHNISPKMMVVPEQAWSAPTIELVAAAKDRQVERFRIKYWIDKASSTLETDTIGESFQLDQFDAGRIEEELDWLNRGGASKSRCFLATAAYGSANAGDLDVLRSFRDEILRKTATGRGFVYVYEQVSPPLADFLRARDRLRSIVRRCLIKPIVKMIRTCRGK